VQVKTDNFFKWKNGGFSEVFPGKILPASLRHGIHKNCMYFLFLRLNLNVFFMYHLNQFDFARI